MVLIGHLFPITLWAAMYGLPDRQCFYNGEAITECESYKVDWSDYRCHPFSEPGTSYIRYGFWYRQWPPFFVQCPKPCEYPFIDSKNPCIKKCPPQRPKLNLDIADCVPEEEKKKPTKQCGGNPVMISSGEKIQQEAPDYKSYGPLPLRFQREYRSYRAKEANIFWQAYSRGVPLNLSVIHTDDWIIYEQPDDYVLSPYASIPRAWAVIDGNGSTELQAPVAGHKQWRHNYESRLVNSGTRLIIDNPKGYKVFRADGDNYVSVHLSRETLVPVVLDDGSDGWRYLISPRYSETYHNDGQLLRISQSDSLYQNPDV